MATAEVIHYSSIPSITFAVPDLKPEATQKVSELLQENYEKHANFHDDSGLHNHIVHHVSTIYALGAPPGALQARFDENASYQRPRPAGSSKVVVGLHHRAVFLSKMGSRAHFPSYLTYFTNEIKYRGWQTVLNEYVFRDTEQANAVFNRLFAGLLHPFAHLGFGIEFEQPAVMAEGMAQACVHPDWLSPFFDGAREYVEKHRPARKRFCKIIEDIRADKKLTDASRWSDDNVMRDGTLQRAKDEMIGHAAKWQVDPDCLEEATAEMISNCAYFTGAAQRPNKEVGFDFNYMHCINASIFFPMLIQKPWISSASKVKLVEWKGRLDLAHYASRKAPELLANEIADYKPQHPLDNWESIFWRAGEFKDDGHASNFVRALAYGEKFCKPYEDELDLPMKGDMWLQLAHMVMDSVEAKDTTWIGSTGFDEAWEEKGNRRDSAQEPQ